MTAVEISRDKGSVVFAIKELMVAKRFQTRKMETTGSGWSDDQWAGRTQGSFQVTGIEITEANALADFEANPESWRPFQQKWNMAFRKNDIVFL